MTQDIRAYVTQQQPLQTIPPAQPGGEPQGMMDFSPEVQKYSKEAEKARSKANRMYLIGNILQGAGMVANTVNSIIQGSKNRIPIMIGDPVAGIGQIMGGMGQTYQNQANRSMAQGMLSQSELPPNVKQMLMARAASNPESAMDSAIKVATQTDKPTLVDLYLRAANGDKAAQEALAWKLKTTPVGGGMVIMPSNQMKNAGELADLDIKVNSGIATPEENARYNYLKTMTIKEDPLENIIMKGIESANSGK